MRLLVSFGLMGFGVAVLAYVGVNFIEPIKSDTDRTQAIVLLSFVGFAWGVFSSFLADWLTS